MEYRTMENLGVSPSALGLGMMRLPTGADGKIDEAAAQAMVDRAVAAGVTYFDTAWGYHDGLSEPFTGKALKPYPREQLHIATKLPAWLVKEAADVPRFFHQQLERLQVDYIDFYLLHALDKNRFDEMQALGVVETLLAYKAAGKIRHLGFSFHDDYAAFETILRAHPWDFCQIQLNYLDVDEQAGLKGHDLAQSLGIPVVVMEPVKGGALAAPPQDICGMMAGADPHVTPAAWALRWAGSLSNVKVVLSGMSSMEQLNENIGTFSPFVPLTATEQAMIGRVTEAFSKKFKNGCTACRYCMPCPNGVNIPRCFSAWNDLAKYENAQRFQSEYFRWMPQQERAENCVRCGACEPACPQHIPIMDDLARLDAEAQPYTPAQG